MRKLILTNELNPDLTEIRFNLIIYALSVMLFKWKIITWHFIKLICMKYLNKKKDKLTLNEWLKLYSTILIF